MLTKLEKQVIVKLLEEEKKSFEKARASLVVDMPLDFLKAEHEYSDFLAKLISKLDG